MKWRELEQEQQRDLDYKITVALRVIQEAIEVSGRPALAFSGGKDSTVLLDMFRRYFPEHLPRTAVIYGNTGVEYPECVKFARWIAREWNLDFHEARPGKTTEAGFKYEGQRRIWQALIHAQIIDTVLKDDGKLKSTQSLENACPASLRSKLERERLVWREGTLMSYWWCADQYGWPILGKSWSRLDARRISIDTFLRFSESQSNNPTLLAYYEVLRHVKISQHCCKVLKKDPSERVQAELGSDLIFKGLMASESRARTKNFLTRGYLFEGAKRKHLHGDPFFHCQPLAIWTDEDIWNYIKRYEVPYSSLYDMKFIDEDGNEQCVKRNGCLGCATDFGFPNNHLYVLRQTHPRAWHAIMRAGMAQQIRNLQRVKRDGQMAIFDVFSTEELIELQPCVFDDLEGLKTQPVDGLIYDPEVDDDE